MLFSLANKCKEGIRIIISDNQCKFFSLQPTNLPMSMLSDLQKKKPLAFLKSVAAIFAVGAVLVQFARFLFIAFSRIAFPFTLEWMEGGSFVQVSRILAGTPIYVKPSFDFVPQIYPPFYFYLSALVSKILGAGFFSLRLVSITATLGILILIFVLVYKQTGSRLGGILASGLFCATYELSGHWFDIARVDSLALALLLLSVYFLLKDNTTASIIGGIILALSVFTKQTMLILAMILLLYCILPSRKNNLVYIGVASIGLLGGTVLLDRLHDGWYSYYIFHLPGRHRIIPNVLKLISSTNEILFIEIVRPVFFAATIGIIYLLLFPQKMSSPNGDTQIEKSKPSKTWQMRAVWLLVFITGILAIGSIWFLASLPSDVGKGVLGSYTILRLLLMTGPALMVLLVLILAAKMKRDIIWADYITNLLFANIHTVPRILLGCATLAGSLIILLENIWPNLIDDLSIAHLQRLSPYVFGPVFLLVLMAIMWRLLWRSIRTGTWFYLLLGPGLITVSWIGRLNPGGYFNVFMPAYAGIAILFGLGIGTILNYPQRKFSARRNIISILVLLFSGVQLLILLSQPLPQIPTRADKEAGLELVERIKNCPGDVYVPFHTYLAELADKDGYAGVIEMGELKGNFGGRADPLWKDVLSQMQLKLEMQEFTVVIQDNQIFRDAMSDEYVEKGQVFDNELSFWPVTGRKIHPDTFYEPIDAIGCFVKVE